MKLIETEKDAKEFAKNLNSIHYRRYNNISGDNYYVEITKIVNKYRVDFLDLNLDEQYTTYYNFDDIVPFIWKDSGYINEEIKQRASINKSFQKI